VSGERALDNLPSLVCGSRLHSWWVGYSMRNSTATIATAIASNIAAAAVAAAFAAHITVYPLLQVWFAEQRSMHKYLWQRVWLPRRHSVQCEQHVLLQ